MGVPHFFTADRPERDRAWGFYGCRDLQFLASGRALARALRDCLVAAEIPTFGGAHHKFPEGGGGVTAVQIIGASCADVHTWPEFGTAIVRCFACGDKDAQVERFVQHMLLKYRPQAPYEVSGREIPILLPHSIPEDWRAVRVPNHREISRKLIRASV